MRTVIQRVTRASVTVEAESSPRQVGAIGSGLVLLVGVEPEDSVSDADLIATKVANLRLFRGKSPMDRSLLEAGSACLVVSQFTLMGNLSKGRRPSFANAASPAHAEPLYRRVGEQLANLGVTVAYGQFGANMAIDMCADGPVTFVLETSRGSFVSRVRTS